MNDKKVLHGDVAIAIYGPENLLFRLKFRPCTPCETFFTLGVPRIES